MHGVTALVGQGEYIPYGIVFIIHENIRIAGVTPRRKGAGSFTFVFVTVGPAAKEALAEGFCVFVPQG